MIPIREAIESTLADAYSEEIAIYGDVLESVRRRPSMDETANGDQSWLATMTEGLDRIANVEKRIAETKAAWQRMDARPGSLLSDRLMRVAELIRQISAEIGYAAADAEAKKRRLMPEMETMAKAHRMQRAYGASL
ncbi:MAG: hypothetical protein K2X38_23030 [Gemmataceae bacterium]|nr:hypothetical protein [Gemmataceae bacterium]